MSAGFDLFAPGSLALLALVSMRIGALLLIAPVFSTKTLPPMLRAALLLLVTLVLLPAAAGHQTQPAGVTAATLFSEALVGFALGLGAAVFVGAAEIAGDVVSVQIGLSSASALEPTTTNTLPVLSTFGNLFVVTLLLLLDGHLVMLAALAGSLEVIPVGAAIAARDGLLAMVSLGSALFGLGLQLAAPVMAIGLVGTVALGILTRAAPQLNALMVAFPVQIGLGLLALGVVVPLIATVFTDWAVNYEGVVSRLLGALAPGH